MAAMKYGCKCIGIEQDAERIEVAKQKAEEAGVLDKITFINANIDEIKFPHFDVAYAYLFPEDLKEIRNKLLGGDRFASFAHQVPNLPMYNNGDFYIWDRDKAFSWYEGRAYTGRICSRNNCSMCASIVNGIKEQKSHRN
jgi:hypothetical protein